MSFFVVRAVSAAGARASQDRADVFARGETAVLVVADGAGGVGDGARAADHLVDRVREAVLDADFDLAAPAAWSRLFADVDRALVGVGETTAVVVVLMTGLLVHAAAGDSEAWLVRADASERLTAGASRARLGTGRARPSASVRRELDGRLVVASDGLFRHTRSEAIERVVRAEKFGAVADALVALTRGEDDVAVLVAER
ncbi:MAG: SpoIIE family protein phosphatase [Labilithrix sp.]|nr:SpoIIE family protein phosphatase [Labilithrix sp.]MCW5816013.1 SpoIIE family protein phosphatase [Labilithrix sp.]